MALTFVGVVLLAPKLAPKGGAADSGGRLADNDLSVALNAGSGVDGRHRSTSAPGDFESPRSADSTSIDWSVTRLTGCVSLPMLTDEQGETDWVDWGTAPLAAFEAAWDGERAPSLGSRRPSISASELDAFDAI